MDCFKLHPEFDSCYVSPGGAILSTVNRLPRILKNSKSKFSGYHRLSIKNKGGNHSMRYVHRLVAQVFIPNPDNLSDVDHIDGDIDNNDISNLRWLSHKDNTHNAFNSHERIGQKGKVPAKPVLRIEDRKVYKSITKADKDMGVCSGYVSSALTGRVKTIKGYSFRLLTPEDPEWDNL